MVLNNCVYNLKNNDVYIIIKVQLSNTCLLYLKIYSLLYVFGVLFLLRTTFTVLQTDELANCN